MRCTHYTDGACCRSEAATALLAPATRKVLGVMCREHGEMVLAEYHEKLDVGWRLAEIDEWGKLKR
jgi:hypothetical protein